MKKSNKFIELRIFEDNMVVNKAKFPIDAVKIPKSKVNKNLNDPLIKRRIAFISKDLDDFIKNKL